MKKINENYSVIMSVYNKVNPEHLKISIESILNQTYRTNDFILIKDGKLTEEQENVLSILIEGNKDIFNIIEFSKNKGAGAAYNVGINNCKNKWAAIMDSDDYAVPEKFEKQMNYLMEHNNIDIIGSNAVEFINNIDNVVSTRIMPEKNDDIVRFSKGRCPMIQPTVIFKVNKVIEAGSYQHSPLTEDYDLYIRLIMIGCVFYTLQEVLFFVRTSDDFFKRRGGLNYLKPILSFKLKYFKNGYFTFFQFLKSFISSLIVSLLPNKIRIYIYKKYLRN